MADPQFTVSDKFAEGVDWRCPRKGCQKIVSIRDSSFSSNSNLPLSSKVIRILHLWSTKTSLGDMMKEDGVRNLNDCSAQLD